MKYSQLRKVDATNGPGIRTTLFVSGCTHFCKGCFNEKQQDFNYGNVFTKETEDKMIEYISKDVIKGVSILGGEPMQQHRDDTLLNLLKRIKTEFPNKPIWVWTGYNIETILESDSIVHQYNRELLNYIDVLIDGRFVEELKDLTLKYRGSSNQRVFDLNESKKAAALSLGQPILMPNYLVQLECQ